MSNSLYQGRRISLLTRHQKERVIAPALESALGCHVEAIDGYDTDLLGTFTRETPRAGTQLEAARRKARIGMELAGLPLGLASEGAFGADPYLGLLPWNAELLIFLDDERQLEVVGFAQGKAALSHRLAASWAEIETFANQVGFPEHQLVMRPDGESDPRIRKGLAAWTELEEAYARALAQSTSGLVFVETDLRAHANPTRMENIRLAAENLAQRLTSLCPACGAPGFWVVERLPGLRCAECGEPTREIRAEVWGCLKCAHRVTQEGGLPRYADPGRCQLCNP